jgi:2,4-dienoyl-CoA reductase-like NADH-dependent reductase (Old Yellow Enzyme family)
VDLIAFGRPYIANPDLAERLKHGGLPMRILQAITLDAAKSVTRISLRIRMTALRVARPK